MKGSKIRLPSIFSSKNITLIAAILVFILFFAVGSISFKNFFSMRNFSNLFLDNAHLLIVTMSQTLVLILGGVDLSCGAIMCLP